MSSPSPGAAGARCPFVSFNCAQYASNPELLAANLFGYVKGAFTGAQSDKAGAFEAANGGMLFLDEVHRPDAQGQEKLFTGWIVRRSTGWGDRARLADFAAVGVCHHRRYSQHFSHHLPAPNSDPVSLPDLQHRSREEKEALTLQFFWQEARTLAARLQLTPRLLQVLTQYVYRGNVGELKNVVKYAVASAWAVSGPRNVDRDAARSAGKCHGRDASAQRSDGPAGAAAYRAADQPGLAAARATRYRG